MKSNSYSCKILFIVMLAIAGCKKFLSINPSTTSVNPTKISDFNEMLNSDSIGTNYFFLLDLTSDDVKLSDAMLTGDNIYARTYLWKSVIWNPSDTDLMYSSSYSRILQMNVILSRLNSAPKDSSNTPQNKADVQSEALINRAWYYLQLTNIYGSAYDANTAESDLSVPLVLTPDASALPSRATEKNMYNQIINDLRTAVSNQHLQAMGANIIHPGKAAGYALLARTYLYMADFDSALLYADSSLALVSSLQNYNTSYVMPTQLRDMSGNPEILVAHISTDQTFYNFFSASLPVSTELQDSLGSFDIRYTKRFYGGVYNVSNQTLVFDNSVGVPEVMLTKAECLARQGNVQDAADIIEAIRVNRITARYYAPKAYNASNIMSYVLSERRKELFYHGGLRLFDLKRLNKETAYEKNLVRMNSADSTIATLPAGSNLYNFPFSQLIIANNTNIIQNPR